MKKLILSLLLYMAAAFPAVSQNFSKLSPSLRRYCLEGSPSLSRAKPNNPSFSTRATGFIKLEGDASKIFRENGVRELARFGDIYIASFPLGRVPALSLHPQVRRIESEGRNHITMDSTAMQVNALPVYQGVNFPHGYTGKGVVVGVMDIGFDLTHPNFYDSTASHYRIKALWDQLSLDTIGSRLYVGRDYRGEEALLTLKHSRDGASQTHGTHTTGIAAGSGFTSPYRGMAFESDICLVANATGNNAALIDSADLEKFNYATDALGFKYIFDYAKSVGKPCVINFSEGSNMDFEGYDQLYYAILDSLTGPGRIIVSSAGNDGNQHNYYHKVPGSADSKIILYPDNKKSYLTLKSADAFRIDTLISTRKLLTLPDSLYRGTINDYKVAIKAYPSSLNPKEICYDLAFTDINSSVALDLQNENGVEADIEGFIVKGSMSSVMPGEMDNSHSVNSPSSAPSVICVGATGYREGYLNYKGDWMYYPNGTDGERCGYSSVGPTFDGRIKPDVMAPGQNIISSYSSFYIENNAGAHDVLSDVEHFDFKGRTYAWNANGGTSMASPVVAGAIALWLQANPNLTPSDILDIFSKTCTHYDQSLSYPNNQYGYGQIDVAAGLKMVADGVETIREMPAESSEVRKVMGRDGHIYILKGNQKYSLLGTMSYSN